MSKFLTLYTWGTPNGYKPSIYLEELKAAYGTDVIDYEAKPVNIGQDIQKEPWFIKINPNGRIPALIDHKRGDFKVFESAAILLYLAQHYDTEHKFSFDPIADPDNYSEALQWIFFAHGGIGPMVGQLGHFSRLPEKIPYAIKRYTDESIRLFGVLEIRFQEDGGREYLAGPGKGKYSIADINVFPWIRGAINFMAIDTAPFPGVKSWFDRLQARETVVAGQAVPPRL